MVKKMQKPDAGRKSGPDLSGMVKESASHIWLAGLGAFAKAQEEGGKVFEALVKEGLAIQRKTQSAAEDKISEATSKMANMATDISSKASGQWDKLENIFEERVARAMGKLGMPSGKDIAALSARVEALERSAGGQRAQPAAAKRAPAARKTATRKPAAKTRKPS